MKRVIAISALLLGLSGLIGWRFLQSPKHADINHPATPLIPARSACAAGPSAGNAASNCSELTASQQATELSAPVAIPHAQTVLNQADSSASNPDRDEKVRRQLEVFMERTEGITAESIAAERARIQEGLKKLAGAPTEMPKVVIVTDEAGERWERMEYKNGTVRYAPVPQEVN